MQLQVKVTKGALVVARESTCGAFYKLQMKIVWQEVNVVDQNSLQLWHKQH